MALKKTYCIYYRYEYSTPYCAIVQSLLSILLVVYSTSTVQIN